MNRRLFIATLIIAWLITGAFSPTPPAPPSGSNKSFLSISESSTDYTACDFPLETKTVASGWLTTRYYADGSPKEYSLTGMRSNSSFTNLINHKALSSSSNSMTQIKLSPDGTITFMSMRGLLWHVVVPGQGSLILDHGDVIISVRINQGKVQPDVVNSGIKDFALEKLCPYLD